MARLSGTVAAAVAAVGNRQSHLDAALELARDGWHVFPLRQGTKVPMVPKSRGGNGCLDGTRDEGQIRKWWTQWPNAGIGANLGDDRIAVDLDFNHEATRWSMLPETRTHHSGRNNGNVHLIYRFEPGSLASKIKPGTNVLGQGVDIRAGHGSYIVLPPTPHEETGNPYWVDPVLTEEALLTDADVTAVWNEAGVDLPGDLKRSAGTGTRRAATRSSGGLQELLDNPPAEGGRNEWLTKVAGHYARALQANRKGYERKVREANTSLSDPLPDDEVDKTLESVWETHKNNHPKTGELPLDDSPLAEWVAGQIGHRVCWAKGLGWLVWNGKIWSEASDVTPVEMVRQELVEANKKELETGTDISRLKRLPSLLAANKIRSVVGLLKGIVEADPTGFDNHADLLNVGNGVVDLRTGELLPHDPSYRFTKITEVNYRPGVVSADWAKALTALPSEVADWMQVRFGQASTGYPTPDDKMPILQGSGNNGKSSVVAAVVRALGGHAVMVPERLLLANPGDHPTELTTLLGARLALLEETPEARYLNVKRLKDVLGTDQITARKIQRDNITWAATHSLFLTTNYQLRVSETDHGTWRRLALVRFPFTYTRTPQSDSDRPIDEGLRDRLKYGTSHLEAVLAWVVEGAQRWYAADKVMPQPPAQVEEDTRAWRGESDQILQFIDECLVFDPQSVVTTGELLEVFNQWQEDRGPGQKEWSAALFSGRFKDHELTTRAGVEGKVVKNPKGVSHRDGRTSSLTGAKRVWIGLRFRIQGDTADPLPVF